MLLNFSLSENSYCFLYEIVIQSYFITWPIKKIDHSLFFLLLHLT